MTDSSARRCVLVVEDNRATRDALADLLDLEGLAAIFAADGRSALDILSRNAERVGVLLVDLKMPVMDGHALIATLRASATLASIPVVVYTAAHDAIVPEGVEVVHKPGDILGLLRVLREHLTLAL